MQMAGLKTNQNAQPHRYWTDLAIALMTMVVLLFLPLGASVSHAGPNSRVGRLSVEPHIPRPNPETIRAWINDAFFIDEIWPIASEREFNRVLETSGLPRDLIREIQGRMRVLWSIESSEFAAISAFVSLTNTEASISVPPGLKARIPAPVLHKIYSHIVRSGYKLPHELFESFDEAKMFFDRFGVQSPEREEFLRLVFEVDGEYYFFYTPDLWPRMNQNLKEALIRDFTSIDTNAALDVKLTYDRSDDPAEIARRYSGSRDPRPIERYLRRLLTLSQSGTVTIPLAKIMHAFIRDNINTYNTCPGPNCHNSALNVNNGRRSEKSFPPWTNEVLDAAYRNYRFVRPEENLQSGDMMMYFNETQLVHSMNFIGRYKVDGVVQEVVFSKNGVSHFSPYIFQDRTVAEGIYFKDQSYRYMVFRKPKPGESVVSPRGYDSYNAEPIYYRDNLTESESAAKARAQQLRCENAFRASP